MLFSKQIYGRTRNKDFGSCIAFTLQGLGIRRPAGVATVRRVKKLSYVI